MKTSSRWKLSGQYGHANLFNEKVFDQLTLSHTKHTVVFAGTADSTSQHMRAARAGAV